MKITFNILISLFVMQFMMSCQTEPKTETQNTPAVAVTLAKASSNSNNNGVNASGQITAKNSANLSTRMMGNVTNIYVSVGDQVKKGDLLLSINNADLQAKYAQVEASIDQANAAYQNAKKDLDRFKILSAQGSASPKELDDMTTRFQMAEASLKAAEQMKNEVQAQFAYAKIKAPFTGIITNSFVKVGDMANPGMPLLSIESQDELQVIAMITESDISSIKNGMPVQVQVKSLNKSLTGKVIEMSQSAKNTGGQYLVKISLDNQDKSVLSGMYVNVGFLQSAMPNTDQLKSVMVTKSALVVQGQLTGVYTVGSENTAILRWLRIGQSFGDQVEVLSGLSADESYVLTTDGRLFNGVKVTIN